MPVTPGLGDQRGQPAVFEELVLAAIDGHQVHGVELVDGHLACDVLQAEIGERRATTAVGPVGAEPVGPWPARHRGGGVGVVDGDDTSPLEDAQRRPQPVGGLVL